MFLSVVVVARELTCVFVWSDTDILFLPTTCRSIGNGQSVQTSVSAIILYRDQNC